VRAPEAFFFGRKEGAKLSGAARDDGEKSAREELAPNVIWLVQNWPILRKLILEFYQLRV
jgi:hypothetical protein